MRQREGRMGGKPGIERRLLGWGRGRWSSQRNDTSQNHGNGNYDADPESDAQPE